MQLNSYDYVLPLVITRCLGADEPQMIDDGTVTAVNLSEAPGDPAGDADPEGPITALTRVETMIKLA